MHDSDSKHSSECSALAYAANQRITPMLNRLITLKKFCNPNRGDCLLQHRPNARAWRPWASRPHPDAKDCEHDMTQRIRKLRTQPIPVRTPETTEISHIRPALPGIRFDAVPGQLPAVAVKSGSGE